MIDLTPVLQAIVALTVSIITYKIIPFIKTKTNIKQQEEIKAWVEIAVSAAEQIFPGKGRGQDKKKYVISWLEGKGFKLDATTLDAMVESAVHDLNQW